MRRSRFPRMAVFLAVFAALVGAALAYDAWIEQVSATRATLSGRHTKCGPVAMSGPKEVPGLRGLKRWRVMARLDDGRLVEVVRPATELPACGATLTIAERVTPWGSVWYSTRD